MPRVLVLALDNWLGAARLPKALQCAGFEVSLLCYPNTLISLTKYANDRDLCLPTDTAEAVARRLITMLEKPARMIIPSDDRALRFLHHIVEVAHTGYLPQPLIDVVTRSLPKPEAFKYATDKEAASDLMTGLGFKTPRRARIWSKQDLREFVDEVGLPVVVKPLSGTAGEGVQILTTPQEVAGAYLAENSEWLVQQYIAGKSCACASVALDGKYIASIPFEKTITHPGETGPATLVTRLDNSEMHRGSQAYAQAAGANGFYSMGYMVEQATGDAYFIEVNARAVPLVTCSDKVGLDLCKTLYARIVGAPLPVLDEAAPRRIAFYPQELHRDPNSPYRNEILDEPLDDPLVHKAMQKGVDMVAGGLA
jgi:carbamoylphosphate synthase large subunit